MDESNPGQIQIFSVEEKSPHEAICIVRCVGGIVRPGQSFDIGSVVDRGGRKAYVVLDWIERYRSRVDFIDPPHSAMVHLSGEGVAMLNKGITITSAATELP